MPWTTRLQPAIHLADGRIIRTLADVRRLILSLPEQHQHYKKWQQLAGLIMAAAQSSNETLIGIVSNRLHDALHYPPFTTARLLADEIEKKPPTETAEPQNETPRKRP